MKSLLNYLLSAFLLFSACQTDQSKSGSSQQINYRKAKGGKYYGGIFKLNESEYLTTLYPPNAVDAISTGITNQIFEGLIHFSQDSLTILPALAESWTMDESGKIYTFKIRKGVKFHDNDCFPNGKGRELIASDFKWLFEHLCLQKENTAAYSYAFNNKVLGANKYFEASANGNPGFDLEGVKVLDDYTLQIILVEPYSSFLYMLSLPNCNIFPKESFEKYGVSTTVGTGPFIINRLEKGQLIVLQRNPNYYRQDEFGNQLPFLDSIMTTFLGDKKKEVEEFRKGNLDMTFAISTDMIIDILEAKFDPDSKTTRNYIQQRTSEMKTQYYRFLNSSGIFSDKNLRKAFCYAIDRQLILDKTLDGEAFAPGIYGITPPVFQGYDVSKIKGYSLDVKKAKELLAKAGYPDGKNFPKLILTLNKGGGVHMRVGEEVQRQLKENLNIDIELSYVELEENITLSRQGKSVFSRMAWIADYPIPETFLLLFYGRDVPKDMSKESWPNMSRYVNPKFDELFEKGIRAKTIEERNKLFMQAEQIAIDDAPVMVLWYTENYRILQPYIRNLDFNAMDYRDFSGVWIDAAEINMQEKPEVKKGDS